MTPVLYIGKTPDYISHFRKYWSELVVLEGYIPLESEIGSYADIEYILLESMDISYNIDVFCSLKKIFTKAHIILVSDKSIPKGERVRYLESGLRSTLSPYATNKSIRQIIDYYSKKETFSSEIEQNKQEFQTFNLPLGKRIFDIVMSSISLLLLLPLFIIIAILIRIESKGPIIYKSKRVGSNYKIFDFLKFRSMYPDADKRLKEYLLLNQYNRNNDENLPEQSGDKINEDLSSESGTILIADDYTISEDRYLENRHQMQENSFIKYKNDPRIIKIGKFIRKYSIDELPQLINILKGDMSFVGNRPLPLYEAELLTTDNYVDRFIAPAGLTGLWQVEKRGGSAIMSAEERKQLDIYYAQHCSFWFDMKIIFKTFFSFVQKENV
ncbi:sugar transferase [Dysgonomonas sp. HDW5B]|uniref:sugar transferase n=1 Tax=Dysgonomonas sp. HDW5B TaxID=2714927 RepID=UPI0014092DC5|nr:sugar transferase [Dysgonomonas sp. HDW5B]QIK54857.1 sugar transferase [Dysgonomonas sp. HDW5B]